MDFQRRKPSMKNLILSPETEFQSDKDQEIVFFGSDRDGSIQQQGVKISIPPIPSAPESPGVTELFEELDGKDVRFLLFLMYFLDFFVEF